MRQVVASAALFAAIAACGGGDAGGGGGDAGLVASPSGTVQGTCDMSAVATIASCMQEKGSAIDVTADRNACLGTAGAVWTTSPCPAANLIGCCLYTLGPERRECVYPNASRKYDPRDRCTTTTFNGVPGVWVAAPVLNDN